MNTQRTKRIRAATRWVVFIGLVVGQATIVGARAAEVDAILKWSKRVELGTPVSGVVVEVVADVGQHVTKDQVLLRLDTKVRVAEVEQAKAKVAREARLRDEAQREMDRSSDLFAAQLMAEHDMEVARIALDEAQARFQTAKAELARAESDLYYSEVRAPFDSVVVQRMAEVGQTVAAQLQTVPLLVVAEADVMVARAAVSSGTARGLKPEQKIVVKLGGRDYEGRVTRVGLEPLAKRDEPRYPVDVAFGTRGTTPRAGEPAKIVLP